MTTTPTPKWTVLVLIGLLVFGAWRCGSWLLAPSSSNDDMSLSQAFCSDLRKGYTPLQILVPTLRSGKYSAAKAADLAYGFAAISCPDQLKNNFRLRDYLNGWDIDPDA